MRHINVTESNSPSSYERNFVRSNAGSSLRGWDSSRSERHGAESELRLMKQEHAKR